MKVSRTSTAMDQMAVDAIVVTASSETLAGPAAELNELTGGQLAQGLSWEQFAGKPLEIAVLPAPAHLKADAVVVCGTGDQEARQQSLFRSMAAGARAISGKPRAAVAAYLPEGWSSIERQSAVAGLLVGCQGPDLYRAEKKRHPFEDLYVGGIEDPDLEAGRILGESMNLARRLVNAPASEIYPVSFAAEAQQVAQDCELEIEIWDEQRLAKERCGSLLGVARGSAQPPRLVIMKHAGGGDGKWLGLVGKGVTFDSGGLSLKSSEGMKTMKCDMAGAATVLATMQAIAKLKLPINVLAVMGLVENMVSGDSYKLGDVLTARNGKTIEVLNTDAEGRLVLADALDVAIEQGASQLIDLATLTGACVVALGLNVVGAMSNDQAWCDDVLGAASRCGEPIWQLPMFAEYGEQIRSSVADIKNIGEGRWGGAITAAKFLEEFVADTPWVHLDIAGPAFLDSPKSWLDAGGSGTMVRSLVELARGWRP